MCQLPNTGGLHRTSGNAPLETHNLTHHNPWQPRTNCRTCAERSVIEDTIECNSWGKSKCEWMCCIPNTEGLYRTSVDAPLETHNLTHNTTWQPRSNGGIFAGRSIVEDAVERNTHPPWCHVTKSNSLSSRRTQVAANAYKDKPHKSTRRTTKHKKGVNANRKWYKQIKFLKDVQVCNVESNRRVQYMSSDYIRKNIVVCNGGDTTSDAIKNTLAFKSIHYLQIRYGDLWVADTVNGSIGLCCILPGESLPVFICLSRDESLGIMNNSQSICKAMQPCTLTQCQSLARGTNNHVFMENGNKYCCVGAHPGRAERGVQSGLYRLKYGFPSKEWGSMHRVLKRVEYAFDRYMDTDIIQHISCARSLVKFKTMEPSQLLTHKKLARYYNGLGFGINVYLTSHIDGISLCQLFKLTLTTTIIKSMIGSYVTLLSQELEWLWHFGLVTFFYLIHKNRTLFLLPVEQERKILHFFLP
jgi:hypothetical protein